MNPINFQIFLKIKEQYKIMIILIKSMRFEKVFELYRIFHEYLGKNSKRFRNIHFNGVQWADLLEASEIINT